MTEIIELKISLNETQPLIWRRIQVEKNITFFELHHIIQISMGWKNCHLFEFNIHNYRIGCMDEEFFEDDDKTIDANTVTLDATLIEPNEKFQYEYDLGDGWQHLIQVEDFFPKDNKTKYPICIDGALSCPPEDCGGIGGYYNMLEIIKDKDHPEYKEIKQWLGKGYDPAKFDIGKVNKQLYNLKSYIKKWNKD